VIKIYKKKQTEKVNKTKKNKIAGKQLNVM